jgi:uncharacterized protein (DUF983 family)
MHDRCSACDEQFEREPGQWLGAIYINLGLTALVVVTGVLLTETFISLTPLQQLAIWLPITACLPICCHRVAKGLWISLIFMGEGLYIPWPHR